MKKAIIWDLDGTLLDSYEVIVESIYLTFLEYEIPCKKDEIYRYVISSSIGAMFAEYSEKFGIDIKLLKSRYSEISAGKYQQIKAEKQAYDVLQCLAERGVEHYVFTHRGKTTLPVLDNLNLTSYFNYIITSQHKFQRKPHPEGLHYLMQTYHLDPKDTCYVGDRRLDMECARNAGITGILYMPDGSLDVSGCETFRIKQLLDILDIL